MRTTCTLVGACFASMVLSAGTIEVGPNILVSRESGLPKVEMMMAANPKNAKNLLGTAIAATPFTEVCTVYVSFDGGYSWRSVVPPGLPDSGSGDPQVAFGSEGTAYFSALGLVPDETRRQRFAALLFRSRDGGLTWEKIATFGSGTGPDHDMMVADPAGRLFVSLVYRTAGQSNIGIYRLDAGESTLRGPLRAAGGAGAALFTWNPVVFSDGDLFVPFQISTGAATSSPAREIRAAVSRDAGATFSSAERIGTLTLDPHNPVNPYGNVAFAADIVSGRFHDRLYMLWNDAAAGSGYRLKLAYSADKGKTWSTPREVDTRLAHHANAFRPAIAVSSSGTVGISWLDTRDSASGRTYREYFSASLDGGATFLDPVMVSSAESSLDAASNFALHPTIDSPRTAANGNLEFSFNTTLGRFPDGGDYLGLAADAVGTFHPLWADTRTGTFQAWTAAVRVEPPVPGAALELGKADELAKRLRPVFDPAAYDPQTRTEAIPIRFQNISDAPVCAPLIVTVLDTDTGAHQTPRLLNADNHKEWNGAYFDYSRAFRDLSCLAPGEITEAIVWQVQPLPSEKTFVTISVSVTHERPDR